MKPTLIEAALNGINPVNASILALILALPLEQQENALMILTGYQAEVPVPTELAYNGRRYMNIRNIEYNPLTDEVRFEYTKFRLVSVRLPFKKDSEEYQSLKEQLAPLNEDAAKELARAFHGSEYCDLECADTRDEYHTTSLDNFKNAVECGDLNGPRKTKR